MPPRFDLPTIFRGQKDPHPCHFRESANDLQAAGRAQGDRIAGWEAGQPGADGDHRQYDDQGHRPGVSLAETAGKRNLRVPGGDRQGGEDRFVVRQSCGAAGAAGAGHRGSDPGGQATGIADVEGSDGAVSGGVGGAASAVWR